MTEQRLRHFDFGTGNRTDNVPPSMEVIAAQVRELYCILYRKYNPRAANYGRGEMPQWDGGRDQFGGRHKPIWPAIAALLVREQFNPATYLQVQFQETNGRASPRPPQLLSNEAVGRYRAYLLRADEILKKDLERGAQHFNRRLHQLATARGTQEQKIITALMDEVTVQACVLYRYCVAAKFNITLAMQRYYAAALQQYLFQADLYDRAWGTEIIPDQLRQEAQRLRAAY
jgi:hypothetical protein